VRGGSSVELPSQDNPAYLVVLYHATNCGGCVQFKPMLARAVKDAMQTLQQPIKIVGVESKNMQEVVKRLKIDVPSYPWLTVYTPKGTHVYRGDLSYSATKTFLNSIVSN
jgi:hypothetical protein